MNVENDNDADGERRRIVDDPRPGDVLINASRAVIRRTSKVVIFGIEQNGSFNDGAYVCSLDDWREWAKSACLPGEDWR